MVRLLYVCRGCHCCDHCGAREQALCDKVQKIVQYVNDQKTEQENATQQVRCAPPPPLPCDGCPALVRRREAGSAVLVLLLCRCQHLDFEREIMEGQRLRAESDQLKELELRALRERMDGLEVPVIVAGTGPFHSRRHKSHPTQHVSLCMSGTPVIHCCLHVTFPVADARLIHSCSHVSLCMSLLHRCLRVSFPLPWCDAVVGGVANCTNCVLLAGLPPKLTAATCGPAPQRHQAQCV